MSSIIEVGVDSLVPGSIYACIGLGIVLIYRGTGVVNFGHGEAVMLGAFGSVFLHRHFDLPIMVVLGIILVLGGVVGAVVERGLFRRLMRSTELEMVIATLAVAIIIRGLMRSQFGSEPFSVPAVSDASVSILGTRVTVQALTIIGFGALVAVLGWWVIQRSRIGLLMRVTAADPEMSQALGVDVRRVFSGVWSASFAICAVSGALIAAVIFARVDMGFEPLVKGLAGAILGGFGSLPGAIVGPYLVAFIETVASDVLSSAYRDTYAFLVIFAVLLIRPGGLFNVEVKKRV